MIQYLHLRILKIPLIYYHLLKKMKIKNNKTNATQTKTRTIVTIRMTETIIEGSLQNGQIEKQSREEAQPCKKSEGRRSQVEKMRREESQTKEDAGARKGRKVPRRCVFPMFCGSGVSKSRLAKVAGAEPAGQMKDEKLHAAAA